MKFVISALSVILLTLFISSSMSALLTDPNSGHLDVKRRAKLEYLQFFGLS
jgi:hypothetical protein